jgi:TolB protein
MFYHNKLVFPALVAGIHGLSKRVPRLIGDVSVGDVDRRNKSGDDRLRGVALTLIATRTGRWFPAFAGMTRVLGVLGLIAFALASSAQAQLKGTVQGGLIDPLPVAISPFIADGEAGDVARTVADVITNDLGSTGYFAPVSPDSFIEQIANFEQEPRYADWRQIQAKALVVGQAVAVGGKIQVSFKLYDVNAQSMRTGQTFAASPKNARRIAHRIADMIYKELTGYEGYFDTRIVFINESGPKDKREKKLAIMDQDGFNPRTLPVSGDLLLTPRFSPTSLELTFMSFGSGVPRVYIYNIETQQKEIVGDFPNMSFAPRYSPDGQSVVMSLQSDDGRNSNIFELDLRSRQLRQLTDTPAINTAPSFSPDGQQVAFESDRGGAQQIYVMGADGSGQNRISFGNGRYSTPVWSPDGKWIAFTKQAGGKFAIGVMAPDGSGERILTEGFHNEGPTWSPNSRVVMFFRDNGGATGGPQLYSVDISGYNERKIETPGFASDPAWSPRLN